MPLQEAKIITETFRDYTRAFQTAHPKAVVGYFYEPCLFISSEGVRLMANAREIQALITALAERLRARGFSHSEITDMKVSQMSDVNALVSVAGFVTKRTAAHWNTWAKPIRCVKPKALGRLSPRWCTIRMRL
ncbi:MAG TPA: hypothetical protein VH985_11950 [Candidatus Binatia bacterium]